VPFLRLSVAFSCVNIYSRKILVTLSKQSGISRPRFAFECPSTLYPESNTENSLDAEMNATRTSQNKPNKGHLTRLKMPKSAKINQN
jgi:hypothetical protein